MMWAEWRKREKCGVGCRLEENFTAGLIRVGECVIVVWKYSFLTGHVFRPDTVT